MFPLSLLSLSPSLPLSLPPSVSLCERVLHAQNSLRCLFVRRYALYERVCACVRACVCYMRRIPFGVCVYVWMYVIHVHCVCVCVCVCVLRTQHHIHTHTTHHPQFPPSTQGEGDRGRITIPALDACFSHPRPSPPAPATGPAHTCIHNMNTHTYHTCMHKHTKLASHTHTLTHAPHTPSHTYIHDIRVCIHRIRTDIRIYT